MENDNPAYVIDLGKITGIKTLIENIDNSMDTMINGSYNAYDTLHYFQSKPLSLLIKKDGKQAGLIGLSKNLYKSPDLWFTSTLMFNEYRGTGLNTELKRAIASLAVQHDLPLGAIIRDWNMRSYNATRKAFPFTEPKNVPLKPREDHPDSETGFLFDFRNTHIPTPELEFTNLETILCDWWQRARSYELYA